MLLLIHQILGWAHAWTRPTLVLLPSLSFEQMKRATSDWKPVHD